LPLKADRTGRIAALNRRTNERMSIKQMGLTGLGLALVVLALLTIAYLRAPVWLLDRADRLLGGDQGTVRVAEGISYGPEDRNKLDIWAPAGTAKDAKLPVVVFLYGGGWHWGERDHYGFAARALAAQGFVVVVPDYRLYPQVRFPAFVEDSAAAVRWVQSNIAAYGGAPTKVAVAGHSAGAYNTLMLALDRQWLGDRPIQAAISISGPADFYPFTNQNARNALSNAPDPLQTQPVTFVRKDASPILLIHGTADTLVRIRNSDSLLAKQQAAGGTIELRRFEHGSHNDPLIALSSLFRSRYPALKEATTFLRAHM
jgi:acetyl esterase/lipase